MGHQEEISQKLTSLSGAALVLGLFLLVVNVVYVICMLYADSK